MRGLVPKRHSGSGKVGWCEDGPEVPTFLTVSCSAPVMSQVKALINPEVNTLLCISEHTRAMGTKYISLWVIFACGPLQLLHELCGINCKEGFLEQ